jgi:hypothetical protein
MVGPLLKSRGFNTIMTIMDVRTKGIKLEVMTLDNEKY